MMQPGLLLQMSALNNYMSMTVCIADMQDTQALHVDHPDCVSAYHLSELP